MTTAWMVYGIAISALLTAAAHALEHLCRMFRWTTRWAWAGAMFAVLLIPLVVTTWPGSSQSQQGITTPTSLSAGDDAIHTVTTSIHSSVIAASTRIDTQRWLSATWLAASLTLAASIASGYWYFQRRAAKWPTRNVAGVPVMVAPDTGPAAYGLMRSRIVVPVWLLGADLATQRAVIAHESAHIAARDPQLLLFAFLVVALLPWNLPLWYCWRRLRFAIEVDCDQRVLRSGQAAKDYGEALVKVAMRRSKIPLMSTAASNARSLERRIDLLFPARGKWRKSVGAATVLSALTLTATAAQIVPPEPMVAAAETDDFAHARQRSLGVELFNAVNHGEFDSAVALIAAGANVNEIVHGEGTPAIAAARRGDLRLLQLLIEKGALPDLACRGDGNPLIVAAARGHLDVARFLVERGANVNAVVVYDETPLINAARHGDLSMVEFLVERGADINLAVADDSRPGNRRAEAETRSPLGEASKRGHQDVVDYLRSHGAA